VEHRAHISSIVALAGTLALLASACGDGASRAGRAAQRAAAPHEYGTSGAVITQPDGKIVAPSRPFGEFGIGRYTPGGRVDRGFGSNGRTVTDLHANRYGAGALAVALQADGKIVAFGESVHSLGRDPIECSGGGDAAIVRYLPNGRLDPSFGSGGAVMTKMPEFSEGLIAGAIWPSGKIVAVGMSYCESPFIELLGFTPDGRVDKTFGRGGTAFSPLWPPEDVDQVAFQSDGKIVLAGHWQPDLGHAGVSALVRYLPNGHLDRQFGKRGTVLHHFGDYGGTLEALAIQADGKIVAAGSIGQFGIVRFEPDGHLDPSFGSRGKVQTSFDDSSDYSYTSASAVALQGDGKILVGGFYSLDGDDNAPHVLMLVRYTSDGHLDTTFGNDGKIVDRSRGAVVGIAVEPSGRIIVLAERKPSASAKPLGRVLLAYTPDGRPDPRFGG
jgi:uncharacterized delta-60 repeat protein